MMPTILSISLGEMGRVRLCSLRRFITCVVNSLHACEGRRGLEIVLCHPTRTQARAWLLGGAGGPSHSPVLSTRAWPREQITHTLSVRAGTILRQPGMLSNRGAAPSTLIPFKVPMSPARPPWRGEVGGSARNGCGQEGDVSGDQHTLSSQANKTWEGLPVPQAAEPRAGSGQG